MDNVGRVLVIDDEASLRHTLTRILRQTGCEVTSAADGYEALQLLSQSPYELVYLDVQMPGMDGLQTLTEIRRQYPDLAVILFTAYGTLQSAIKALRLGATDYLLKPIDPDVLLSRTRVALNEQAVEQRKRELRQQIEQLTVELRQLEESGQKKASEPLPILSASQPQERFVKCGQFVLDLQTRRATLGSEILVIPPSTFDYLVVLARHAPNTVNAQTLVTEAQGYQVGASEARELAKWHIHILRQAVEPDSRQPRYILTVRGMGYRLINSF